MNLQEILSLMNRLEESVNETGELTSELDDAFEMANITLEDKLDSYAFVIDRSCSLRQEYKAKADEFLKIAKAYERLEESLAKRLKWAHEQLGTDLVGKQWQFKFRPTQGKLRVNCEPSELPKEYQIIETVVKPNNALIKEDLKAGLSIPGCEIEAGTSMKKAPVRKEIK